MLKKLSVGLAVTLLVTGSWHGKGPSECEARRTRNLTLPTGAIGS
jgi:hypothetical protein